MTLHDHSLPVRDATGCKMTFGVQFLAGSGDVVAKWDAHSNDADGAIDLAGNLQWPSGAVVMQILDENGRLVRWQPKPVSQ